MLLYDIYHRDGTMDMARTLPPWGEAGDIAVCVNGERHYLHAGPLSGQNSSSAAWQSISDHEASRLWPRPAVRRGCNA